jgi:hypothetical protein
MTTRAACLNTDLPDVRTSGENNTSDKRAYLTKTSFIAVHFDEAGKGRIKFLPKEGMLRVVGPSSCLFAGSEVIFEKQIYHVFDTDLMTRCAMIFETVKAKRLRHGKRASRT